MQRWLENRYSGPAQAERDRAKHALQIAKVHLRTVFEHATDGLLICDSRGIVLACNPLASRLLGDRRSEIIGRPLSARLRQGASPSPMPLRAGEAFVLRDDGDPVPLELRIHEMPGVDDKQCLVQLHDLRDQRQAQERLVQLANFDSLTGLPNRVLFRDRLAQAMSRAQRSGKVMALMFLDLDRFKVVNDSLGHEVGDRLLQHVAHTITACLRVVDSVGRSTEEDSFSVSRLGGDEFTVIAEGIDGPEDAALIAQRLLEALAAPFIVGDEEIVASASIGITHYPTDDVELDILLRHADMAMYRAKSSGRGTYCFFSEDLSAAVSARLSLEGSLRKAIERDEFTLYYQPKVDLHTGDVSGVEALIRWHCPGRGMVPPDRFVSVLEDTGMILPVGAWVIRTACAQLAFWDREGLPPMRMAVNLSARQFRHPFLVALVEDTLREYDIAPARLEIELTESLLMEDTEATRGMLANFARIGLRLALDDFGTGQSSLAYLKRFRIDTLKVDRSFVSALHESAEDRAIASAVVALGHSMHMTVVAEGVETTAQAEILRELGCDEIQGYLLSRPMPPNEMTAWMKSLQQRRPPRGALTQMRGAEMVAPFPFGPERPPSSNAASQPRPGARAPAAAPQRSEDIAVWRVGEALELDPKPTQPPRAPVPPQRGLVSQPGPAVPSPAREEATAEAGAEGGPVRGQADRQPEGGSRLTAAQRLAQGGVRPALRKRPLR